MVYLVYPGRLEATGRIEGEERVKSCWNCKYIKARMETVESLPEPFRTRYVVECSRDCREVKESDNGYCSSFEERKKPKETIKEYIHPNGYIAILYGFSSMSVYHEGKEVMHTGYRTVNTEEEVMELLEKLPEVLYGGKEH